ncbi:MAG: methylated-DNA--[protein]-cysteine S-methyltransferase [Microthrixaceae bacterium]
MPERFTAEPIAYEVHDCWIGKVSIARSATGVCGIFLGDSTAELIQEMNDRFKGALLRPEGISAENPHPSAVTVLAAVVQVCNAAEIAALRLDLRGTAFQLKVWQQLSRIPSGVTQTYSEVASAIGQPTAARAVASACSANPVAVVIPCHRVTAAHGALGGYRWGTERKRLLLQAERLALLGSAPTETLPQSE